LERGLSSNAVLYGRSFSFWLSLERQELADVVEGGLLHQRLLYGRPEAAGPMDRLEVTLINLMSLSLTIIRNMI
jgi:hypothetical protein